MTVFHKDRLRDSYVAKDLFWVDRGVPAMEHIFGKTGKCHACRCHFEEHQLAPRKCPGRSSQKTVTVSCAWCQTDFQKLATNPRQSCSTSCATRIGLRDRYAKKQLAQNRRSTLRR